MMILSVLHSCAGLFALSENSGGVKVEWGGDTLCHQVSRLQVQQLNRIHTLTNLYLSLSTLGTQSPGMESVYD